MGVLGPLLAPLRAVLGRNWGPAGGLRPFWGLCGRSWTVLMPLWAVLAVLGASAGGPGPLLGRMLAVPGRSWDLCWRSWASVGGPGGPGGPDRSDGPDRSEAQSLFFH